MWNGQIIRSSRAILIILTRWAPCCILKIEISQLFFSLLHDICKCGSNRPNESFLKIPVVLQTLNYLTRWIIEAANSVQTNSSCWPKVSQLSFHHENNKLELAWSSQYCLQRQCSLKKRGSYCLQPFLDIAKSKVRAETNQQSFPTPFPTPQLPQKVFAGH